MDDADSATGESDHTIVMKLLIQGAADGVPPVGLGGAWTGGSWAFSPFGWVIFNGTHSVKRLPDPGELSISSPPPSHSSRSRMLKRPNRRPLPRGPGLPPDRSGTLIADLDLRYPRPSPHAYGGGFHARMLDDVEEQLAHALEHGYAHFRPGIRFVLHLHVHVHPILLVAPAAQPPEAAASPHC